MARQIFRRANPDTNVEDIYAIEGDSARYLNNDEFTQNYASPTNAMGVKNEAVEDLGVNNDLYNQYFPQTPTPSTTGGGTPDPLITNGSGFNPDTMADLIARGISPEQAEAEKNWLAIQQGYSQPYNEDDIRQNTLDQFQAQIDALNAVYAEQSARAKQQGMGRLGQSGAIQARRGLLGSDFGDAQTATVQDANEQVLSAIDAEKAYAKSQIYSKVRSEANAEITAKREAREQGASALISYYEGVDERKNTRIGATVDNILNIGLEPTDEELAELAKQLGTTSAILKSEYNRQKAEIGVEEGVKGIEVDGKLVNPYTGEVIFEGSGDGEEEPITQKIGDTLVQYNQETGQWDVAFSEGETVDDISIADQIKMLEGGYTINENGTLVKSDETINPNVDQNTGKPLSQAQFKTKLFGERMESADVIISELGEDFVGETSMVGGLLPNIMKSDDRQRYEQAQRNFVNAVLRQESGAAIAPEEFKSAALQYFPQPGDGDGVIKQKDDNRKQAINGFLEAAGQKATDEEDDPLGLFSSVGSDTNTATISKVESKKDNTDGGQCGRFVNNITGLGVGDTFASKMAKMDTNIKTPEPGMVFTMPYKDTGHCGFIVDVDGDEAIVKDSNWNLDEKVKTHRIPLNKITGLTNA